MTALCMWSGPRNISTAMMRAFENRADCSVVDEPFYACYLEHSGVVHPMQEEILASQSTAWQQVIDELNTPQSSELFYQKHMTHHMLPEVPLNWVSDMRHCFLIRDPRLVVHSYQKKRDSITETDIGVRRQSELFEELSRRVDGPIAVIDSTRFLQNPEAQLRALCDHWQIEFSASMLAWPEGIRESDGVWAPHWYEAVAASRGFAPYVEAQVSLTPELQAVADEAKPYYEALKQRAL